MCPHLRQRLGAEFTLCQVLIQQRVSSKLGHVAVRSSLRKKMQNPSDVVRSWRTCPSRPRTHKRSRRKSRRDSRKDKSGPVPIEELRRQEKTGNKFQPRRVRVSQGIAYSRNPKIS